MLLPPLRTHADRGRNYPILQEFEISKYLHCLCVRPNAGFIPGGPQRAGVHMAGRLQVIEIDLPQAARWQGYTSDASVNVLTTSTSNVT